MATTNFAALTTEQKQVWSRDVWKTARQNSFIMQMAGSGPNAAIQRITELTASERGTRAVITLVADLAGDGVTGDALLAGNEEAINAYDQVIQIDQLRNANRTTGRVADQKSVVQFRETSRDVLAYWLADRTDQIASLTMAGINLGMHTNGALRTGYTTSGTSLVRDTTAVPVGYTLGDLAFAADITAPSAKRAFRWDAATQSLKPSDTTAISATDTPSYAMLVEMKAYAKDRRLRSVRAGAGSEVFHVLMHPMALAKLKLDPDFLANLRGAGARSNSNPLFSGSIATVDGLVIHEFTHCYNTLGATAGASANAGVPGYKWGANADQDGSRVIMLGAQGLAFCDLGAPIWDERDHFDFGNQIAISIAKMAGFKKPVFQSSMDGSPEDFGVMVCDVAI